MLLTTLQMLFAFRSVKHGRIPDWLGLAAFTALNLYTHYVALAVTVAVAVYVLLFVLVDALRGTPWRVKAGIGALLAGAAVAVLLVPWRLVARSTYDFVRLPARAHPALAIALALVIIGAVPLVAGLVWKLSPTVRGVVGAPSFRQLERAVAAAILVSLAYLPWLPSLLLFVGRPDQSLGQIHLDHPAGLSDLAHTLAGLSLSGVTLIALGAGIVVLLGWTFAGKARESALLLLWLGIPSGILAASAGRNALAADPRYLAFMVPAAVIVIAVAVEASALGLQHLAIRTGRTATGWRWRDRAGAVAASAVLVVLLLQTIPALAASYSEPKNDYRAVAQRIAAASPPGSAVIAVGDYADWTVICLDYYFRQLKASVMVVDGLDAGRPLVDQLNSGRGVVWGVVIFPSRDQQSLLTSTGSETLDFVDVSHEIYLVRPSDPSLPPLEEAWTLLRWELPLEPALTVTLNRIGGFPTS